GRCLLSGDVVLRWNDIVLAASRATTQDGFFLTRSLAMVHGAVYDAVNSVERTYTPYLVDYLAPPDTSEDAAAATAAHDVAVQIYPSQRVGLDANLAVDLAAIPDGPAKDQGIALGQYVATAMLDFRRDDGSDRVVTYEGSTEPGRWRPTP